MAALFESGLIGGSGGLDARADFNTPRLIRLVPGNPELRDLRVVTWNIDRGENLQQLAAELKRLAPDLLLLQEVDANSARSGEKDEALELARRLNLNAVYAKEFEELGQERNGPAFIGQATLTRLPVSSTRVLRFTHQSGFWRPRAWLPSRVPLFQRRIGSRMALVTELHIGTRQLVVYNAHLESRSYGRIQAAQIDEIIADQKRYPVGTAVLIGGDLNTKYLPSVFLKKLANAGFSSALGQRIERTHTIAMSLDWIFVKGRVQLRDGRVRRDLGGSDHYPVSARLLTAVE